MMGKLELDNTSDKLMQKAKEITQLAFNQLPHIVPVVTVGLVMIIIVLIGALFVSDYTNTSLDQLTRDPASATNSPFYIGFVSNLGLMVWSATSAMCLLLARLLWKSTQDDTARFFLASCGISLMLLFDDTFLLHENFYPRVFDIPEVAVFAVYGCLVLGYLVYFWQNILKTDFTILFMALIGFGLSIIVDYVEGESIVHSFIEDAFKFTGVVLWMMYFGHTALQTLRNMTTLSGDNQEAG